MKKPTPAKPDPRRAEGAALARVEQMTDPDGLRSLMANARRLKSDSVWEAAFQRLVAVSAEGEPGSVEHDFWRAIHALESALTEERGKTTRLSRTRQKLARAGAVKTVADLALKPDPADGFDMLMTRNMAGLTAEALILRHPDTFDAPVRAAAESRLHAAGCDVAAMRA